MSKPNINVTPLIDVLLVLLIIFMVVTPTRPSRFEARLPQEIKQARDLPPHPQTLIVTVAADRTLALNQERNLGTVEAPEPLVEKLRQTFAARKEKRIFVDNAELQAGLSDEEKIQKTVFVKAPRAMAYGSVVRVVDAVKTAGARPIALQLDDLP